MINTYAVENVIKIDNLAVGYGMREVLDGIRAGINRGMFVSILGPNGVGKTTLLRTLSRHLAKLGGAVYVNGRDAEKYTQKELAKEMAVVLTTALSTGLFTGFEFAAMGRYPYTKFTGRLSEPDKKKVMESLSLVHAENLAGRPMNEMSDGERQKLFIARALSQDPKIIILDEPTSHLDLKHKMEIMYILRKSCMEKNITVIASMHDIELASRVSDQVALIKSGKVIGWGSPEEMLNAENISSLYDINAASYSRTLGTIEMKYNQKNPAGKKVFCVAGSGSGSVIFRLLAKAGYAISTGVLHENDVDFYVANSLGLDVVSAPAYEKITGNMIGKCTGLIKEADFVVDSGFILKSMNSANLDIINLSLEMNKNVFSIRNISELKSAGIEKSSKIKFFKNDYDLPDAFGSNGKYYN